MGAVPARRVPLGVTVPTRARRWHIDHVVGSSADVHGRDFGESGRPELWVVETIDAAVVLGSTQQRTIVDSDRAVERGLDVVKRRSGGGAVLVVPGDLVWLDIVVPTGDPLWDDDVGRAAHWLGDLWAEVLADFGHRPHVHKGAMIADPLARAVCFAGVGPGEVLAEATDAQPAAKIVGIAQRRTRAGARFQCACLLRWDPEPFAQLMPEIIGAPEAERLAHAGTPAGASGDAIVEAFIAGLARH